MRRTILGIALVLLAAAAVVGGSWLERSGTAEQGVDRALRSLPEVGLPDGGAEQSEQPSPDATADGTPAPTPAAPDVVPADGVVGAPTGDSFYWGVHQPRATDDPAALDRLAGDVGDDPAIVMWYQAWGDSSPFPADAAAAVLERGAVPMITWEAWDPPAQQPSVEPEDARQQADQPAFTLSRIVAGAYDDHLRRYAADAAAFGGPVMLRPFHEMNGFWYPWGGTVNGNRPADVVAAWNHVHAIFEAEGADNVTWVWSVNHRSLPDTSGNAVSAYWPGRDRVDWIGVSGFNFGDTSSVSSWQSFEAVHGDVLAELERYDRPVVLAEFATVVSGGDEAAWIRDAFARLREDHPQVGAVVWFDREVAGLRDFRIRATDASARAFRAAIDDPGILGGPAALRTATSQR